MMHQYLSVDGVKTFTSFDDYVKLHKQFPPDYHTERLDDIKRDIADWMKIKADFKHLFKRFQDEAKMLEQPSEIDVSAERKQLHDEVIMLFDLIADCDKTIYNLEAELVRHMTSA